VLGWRGAHLRTVVAAEHVEAGVVRWCRRGRGGECVRQVRDPLPTVFRRIAVGVAQVLALALRERRTAMFVTTPGVTVDLALGAYWTLHLEAAVTLGTADRSGAAELVVVPVGLLGFGPVL
jgi:hypothetical protein